MSAIPTLAYLTDDLPGIGGRLKARLDDFLVEELPAYEPVGEGEHLMLFVEKRQLATTDVARRLSRDFAAPRNDVGYAGLKDKHAITRQHFTVRLTDAGREPDAAIARVNAHPGIEVLWAQPHRNKLHRGHLAANRFVIRIRDVEPTAVLAAKRVLDQLVARGTPNYVGEQRFGYRANNDAIARRLLRGQHQQALDEMLGGPLEIESDALRAGREAYDRGDYAAALEHWPKHLRFDRQALDALRQGRSPADAVAAIDRTQRQFLISALQSAIFNRVLDRRVRDGTFDRLLVGDVAYKHANGAMFAVDADAAEGDNAADGRVARFEVSPTGPMWGPKMLPTTDEPARLEAEVLASFELEAHDLDNAAQGTRRPLRIALRDADISGGVDEHGPYVRLAFELPPGAFATVALREIMKNA